VLTVPIASVTTRLPKEKKADAKKKDTEKLAALNDPPATNSSGIRTNANDAATNSNSVAASTNALAREGTNTAKSDKKAPKPIEVVFILDGERVKMVPVKIGISDDSFWEVTEGLKEGQEVVSGGYRAISRDLEEGKKVKKGPPPGEKDKEKEKEEEQGKT
jgi:HlyD family secretion protein